jgi:MFS family permease
MSSQYALLQQRRFAPLFLTQFLGSFNDNFFKNALIILLAFTSIRHTQGLLNPDTLINLCATLFILPFFLFSAFAGQLADKYEKSRLIQIIKLVEIGLAVLIMLGFLFDNLYLLLTSLFLLGTHATFFGPLKFSILPQHLKTSELLGGNGLIEMGTFISILIGTIMGGILVAIPHTGPFWVAGTVGIIAILGWWASTFIPKAESYATNLKLDWNPIRQSLKIIQEIRKNKNVYYGILGISWFWLYGSTFITQTPNYTKVILGGDEHVATLLLTMFSIGIGVGSMLCERLAHKKINSSLFLVLIGSLGLSIFAVDLYFAHPHALSSVSVPIPIEQFVFQASNWRILMDTLCIGIFGGFYIVPLYAFIQKHSEPDYRSRVIAANNIINAIFMVGASVVAILLLNAGFSIPQLFLITGLFNILIGICLYFSIPEFRTLTKLQA